MQPKERPCANRPRRATSPLLARRRDRMMCAARPILGPRGIRNENLLTLRG